MLDRGTLQTCDVIISSHIKEYEVFTDTTSYGRYWYIHDDL